MYEPVGIADVDVIADVDAIYHIPLSGFPESAVNTGHDFSGTKKRVSLFIAPPIYTGSGIISRNGDITMDENNNITTSYYGTFKPDSFSTNETGVTTAILQSTRQDGETIDEHVVKGYNDNAEKLRNAYEEAGSKPVILGGTLLGGRVNPHMGVHRFGPEVIKGTVKSMKIVASVVQEFESGKTYTSETTFRGDDIDSARNIQEGDQITFPARRTQTKGNSGEWYSSLIACGEVMLQPAAANDNDAGADSPSP